MKHFLFTLLFLSFVQLISAQSPDSFQFQAVIRSNDGALHSEKDVTVKFSIKQGTASGSTYFIEKHKTKTDKVGIINVQIGKGVSEHGSLSQINWANGPYFIEIEVDKGAGFESVGTQQLLSVPYAQYSKSSENVQIKSPNGKVWNIIINNDGTISTQEITQ